MHYHTVHTEWHKIITSQPESSQTKKNKSKLYLILACSRLRDGGGKSFSNKKCEKRAGAGERQGSPIFPAATAPFPKSCAFYFRFARFNQFNTFPLYYLRAWHRLSLPLSKGLDDRPHPHCPLPPPYLKVWILRCRLTLTVKNFQVISNLLFQFIHTISGILVGPRESLNWKNQFPCSLKHSLETFQDLKTCS